MGDNLGVGFRYEDIFEMCQKAIGGKDDESGAVPRPGGDHRNPYRQKQRDVGTGFRRRNIYSTAKNVSVKIVGGSEYR